MRQGETQDPEGINLGRGTRREILGSWLCHKPPLPVRWVFPMELFVAISKPASLSKKYPAVTEPLETDHHQKTLSFPGTPGPSSLQGKHGGPAPAAQGMGRPERPTLFLEVTPYVRRDRGFIDSLNRVKLSSSCITHSWPIPAGGKSGEADVYSPAPQLFSFEQMTPLSNMAVNCLNKCKVQIAAKNLSQLPKKLQNTSVF